MRNNVSHADLQSYVDELTKVKRLKLEVYDRDRTLAHIVTRAKACAQIERPVAICVDYLQRYDAQQERGETRDMALGRFTMAMKDLAIELNIPVILLAQLNRSVEKENREPRMSDLRESGNLEQDADRIIFLNAPDHRPDGAMQHLTDNDVRFIYVDAIQAKGRSDGTGRCGMMFDRPITKFLPYVAD
jgi:replicative DNA helicase